MATKRRKKSQAELLHEAAETLDRARRMEPPHILVNFHDWMPSLDTPKGKRLLDAVKELRLAYQDFYDLKKLRIEVLI